MARHLHLVPAGADLAEPEVEPTPVEDTNIVDFASERMRRRGRYHPAAGAAWLDDLFDDDPLDPVC